MTKRSYVVVVDSISIEPIVEAMKRGEQTFHIVGIGDISISSTRLRTYTKGTECVTCGKKASFFRLERHRRHGGTPHLNLYIDQGTGGLRMMTSDHIVPKSRGGDGSLNNRQPMCCSCNFRKGNLLPGEVHTPKRPKEERPSKLRRALRNFLALPNHLKNGMPLEVFFEVRAKSLVNLLKHENLFSEEEKLAFHNSGLV